MPSLRFPSEGQRMAVSYASGEPVPGKTATFYAQDGVTLAEIYADSNGTKGASIASATRTLDQYSQFPDWWGPNDLTDWLYVSVNGGPKVRIDAAYDQRLDTLTTGLAGSIPSSGGSVTGDISFAAGKGTRHSALTGDSSVTRSVVFQNADDYSRSWLVYLDKNSRLQATNGWHGVNSGDGSIHSSWEVKTSVSPGNANPALLQTRLSVKSDQDLSDVIFNYCGSIFSYRPDDSLTKTLIWDTQTGNLTTLGIYTSQVDAANYLQLRKKATSGSSILAVDQTGTATLDLDAVPSDGTSSSQVRLFRNTTTANSGAGLFVYRADGTSTVQAFIGARSNSYVCSQAGNFGIGNSSPSVKLHITGDTIRLDTARTPASSSASGSTGEITWDAGFVYVCVGTNTWKRAGLTTW